MRYARLALARLGCLTFVLVVLPLEWMVLYFLWKGHYEHELAKVGVIQGGDASNTAGGVASQWMLALAVLQVGAMAFFFRRRARRSAHA